MRRTRYALGALVLVFAASCGGGGSTAPSVLQVAGTWAGSVTSNVFAPGATAAARVTFTQSGSDLTGSWSAGSDSGQLTGTVSGSAVQMVLKSSVPTNCPSTVNVTVSGNRMTGTYAVLSCSVPDSGSIDLSKQ